MTNPSSLQARLDAMVREAKTRIPDGPPTNTSLYAYRQVARQLLRQLDDLKAKLAESEAKVKELEAKMKELGAEYLKARLEIGQLKPALAGADRALAGDCSVRERRFIVQEAKEREEARKRGAEHGE